MEKKKIISLVIFIIGLATLTVGLVFLILHLTKGSKMEDGEYLVSAKEWILEDNSNCEATQTDESEGQSEDVAETNCLPKVFWDFTEIGKGTLTTNNHLNDYEFIWAIKDGKLKIETSWLYPLENEYDYELNQNDGILTLTADEKAFTFVANFESE